MSVTTAEIQAHAADPDSPLRGLSLTALDMLVRGSDFDGSEGYWRRFLTFNVAKLFGGVVPPRWALVVHNDAGAPIVGNGFTGGDGSKYWAAIQGYQAESI